MMIRYARALFNALIFVTPLLAVIAARAAPPEDFPRFIVPGHEAEMGALRNLFWHHYSESRPLIVLWDEWLPNATLWPARGSGAELNGMRHQWATALASRPISDEGYVFTQQHDGPAHAEGWPFPLWTQAGGIGWHFRPIGVAGYEAPAATPDQWKLKRAESKGGVGDRGWDIELTEPRAWVQSPGFKIDSKIAPWLRLNWWATGLEGSKCYIEWKTDAEPKFSPDRRVYFVPTTNNEGGETRTMIRMYGARGWAGTITGLRIGFANKAAAKVTIKSFHTASDTRHNINNLNFIRGCHDYFLWSLDTDFLRSQIGRIRTAMRYVEREFQTRERKCVYTTWPGHEGRSGVVWNDGKKQLIAGEGIGSNYWDLLPFGGEDALATVYLYDTLRKLAELEEQIVAHPAWKISTENAFDPADLRKQAADVKSHFNERFWNPETGRFGTIDLDGKLHEYGFTFLNNEAVSFGIVSPEHAKSIYEWMSGARTVAGDTSTGDDIYHFRFGPRSTTRRNIDYYFWGWSNPEGIPWGGQVQDGGAVLGWSYYDLTARLKTAGPDDIAPRLKAIADWFEETQKAGGYRAYYAADAGRGTMQGGGAAGGLGLDNEFFESVMVTQVMLYGLLGFQPTADGFVIAPQLPRDWPELTITRIHLHDSVLDITANRNGGLKIKASEPGARELIVEAPAGTKLLAADGVKVKMVTSDQKK
jgi:hypothetical protein